MLSLKYGGVFLVHLLKLIIEVSSQSVQNVIRPQVTEVSAMCSEDGITVLIMFDRDFLGTIYSERYPTTHDCVYYNSYDMNMILFSIPNSKCGTQLTRSINNRIQRIENEVYLQWDKQTQQADDRRYLFICEATEARPNSFLRPTDPSLARPVRPVSPVVPDAFPQNVPTVQPDFNRATITPAQTIVVETIQSTRVLSGNEDQPGPSVYMEIQDGLGPGRPPVQRILQLGEQLTLVVSARTNDLPPGTRFDMRVHSCHATDGTGESRAELIDENGCAIRQNIVEPLKKTLLNGQLSFYTPIRTFKFPSSEDVYFSCSVDTCSSCSFPDPCSARAKRSLNSTDSADTLRLLQSIRIQENVAREVLGYRFNLTDSHLVSSAEVMETLTARLPAGIQYTIGPACVATLCICFLVLMVTVVVETAILLQWRYDIFKLKATSKMGRAWSAASSVATTVSSVH